MLRYGGKTSRARRRQKSSTSGKIGKREVTEGKAWDYVHMPSCTRDYLSALTDPVGIYSFGAHPCVPDSVCLPSVKRSYRVRGVFQTGTNNFGYVMLNPYFPANDNVGIKYTDNTNTATAPDFFNAVAYGANDSYVCDDFTSADYDPTAQSMRVVGAGIKVWWGGTRLDLGGSYIMYEDASNHSLFTQNYELVRQYPGCIETEITKKPVEVHWRPRAATDFNYNGTISGTPLCIMIAANSAVAQQNFHYELVVHYEFVGESNIGGYSKSHNDAVGFNVVTQIANNDQNVATKRPQHEWLKKFANAARSAGTYVLNHIPQITQGASALLGGSPRAMLTAAEQTVAREVPWIEELPEGARTGLILTADAVEEVA